ncbi:hypothetical protein [Caldimonas brevitalea]|uniref:Uncharacterized protein n=1 Tax=Caldimonas brevitalea TaxID=413882 RepID=A0A0G3BW86_9BURK|nr:hypothetical protein [Caldimonas brevitalea]AKJ31661.1 hypothetical protein AAW51_4970 [Caldimonas brevitalea]
MENALHLRLKALDLQGRNSDGWLSGDSPENFDFRDAVRRAQQCVVELESKLDMKLCLVDNYQDAFFWGEIREVRGDGESKDAPFLAIRFSSWGQLASHCATTSIVEGEAAYEGKVLAEIRDVLNRHGFLWVDGDVLRGAVYDGFLPVEKMTQGATFTWWDRFFEYD